MMNRFVLVFVCTGNICRSPMAEGILKDLVLDEFDEHERIVPIDITSAGTHGVSGSGASRYAVEVAAEHEISLNYHFAKQLSDGIVKNSDLILTMETAHVDFIRSRWPFFRNACELKRFGRESEPPSAIEVMDPIGMSAMIYEAVFDDLLGEIRRIAPLVFRLADEKSGN